MVYDTYNTVTRGKGSGMCKPNAEEGQYNPVVSEGLPETLTFITAVDERQHEWSIAVEHTDYV